MIQIRILNGKQCRSRSVGLFRNQLSWIYTVCKDRVYPGSAGLELTLKEPRKPASENVVCLYRLLHLLANFSNILFAYRQTVWTSIRLLLKEQSDLGPYFLQKWLLKSQSDEKATIVVIGSLRFKAEVSRMKNWFKPPEFSYWPFKGSSSVVVLCASVVSYVAFVLSLLFLISPFFGASGGLCMIVAFPGYLHIFLLTLVLLSSDMSCLLKKPTDLDLHCLPFSLWICINNLISNLIGWKIKNGRGILIYSTRQGLNSRDLDQTAWSCWQTLSSIP